MSKMSRTVTVSLVAAAAAGAIAYVASNNVSNPDEIGADLYTGKDPWKVCMASGRAEDECRRGWEDAKAEHQRTTVQYSTLEQCEAITKTKCTDGSEQLDERARSTNDTAPPSSGPSVTTYYGGGGSHYWSFLHGYYVGSNNAAYAGPIYSSRSTSAPVTSTGSAFRTAANGTTTVDRPAPLYKTDPYVARTSPSAPSTPPAHPAGSSAQPTQTTKSTPSSTPSHTTTSQRGGFGSTPSPGGSVGG